jgi:hypothetical protein
MTIGLLLAQIALIPEASIDASISMALLVSTNCSALTLPLAIVKPQIRYEIQSQSDERWAMGTGWLIDSDLLVTAGHCVYGWANEFGRAVCIKAYIGCSGRDSVNAKDTVVEFRPRLSCRDNCWLALTFIRQNQ